MFKNKICFLKTEKVSYSNFLCFKAMSYLEHVNVYEIYILIRTIFKLILIPFEMDHKKVKVLPHNIIIFSGLNSKSLINLKKTPIISHVHDSVLTFNQFKKMRRKHKKKNKK